MKTITLTQPWATLVALREKRIETRSWRVNYRGPLAIHAAKRFPPDAQYLCFKEPFRKILVDRYSFVMGGEIYLGKHKFPLGAIVATCRLVDIQPTIAIADTISDQERAFGDYSPGRFAWILEDIEPLAQPVPAKGKQGLWEWKKEGEA